jgi:hypothetical protein
MIFVSPIKYLACLLAIFAIVSVAGTKQAFAQSSSADIIIMIDLTGSTSLQDLELEKNAARTLLQSLVNVPNRPRVAIGTFNEPNGNSLNPARILSGGELTQNYSQLNQVINGITATGGFTDLAAAINIAQAHLESNALSFNRYIVLISDGTPNRPGQGDYNLCDNCGCDDAYAASSIARQTAELHGTKVFAIHYAGSGINFCVYEPERGEAFMHDQIATNPTYFYQGNSDLSGVFNKISCSISCDDSNACTQDSCDESSGLCRHDPITSDTDSDGVIDCQDKCRGNDALLNTACTDSVDGCPGSGFYACNAQGNVSCKLSEASAQSCYNCTSLDQGSALNNIAGTLNSQKSVVDKFIKSVSKLSKNNKKVQKEIRSIKVEAKNLLATSMLGLQAVPSVFLECANQQRCTDVYESARIGNLSTSMARFKALSDKLYSRLRKLTRNITKSDRKLKTKASQVYATGKAMIQGMPQTRSECS